MGRIGSFARLAIAGVIVGTFAAGTGAAQAQAANGVIVGYDYQVELSGWPDVCTDNDYTYVARVVKYTIYDDNGVLRHVPQGPVPAQIRVTISGRSTTGTTIGGGSNFFGGGSFPARFPTAGRYRLDATASGVPIVPGDPLQASVTPAGMDIQADVCDLRMTMMSIWFHLPDGFKPWVGAVIDDLPLTLGADQHFRGSATLSTFAMPAATGGCTATFKTTGVTVTVDGVIRPSGLLYFDIEYTFGTAIATAKCPGLDPLDSPPSRLAIRDLHIFIDQPDFANPTMSRIVPHVAEIQSLQTYNVNGVSNIVLQVP